MQELHDRHPEYKFCQHKGYPTFEHRSLLLAHGPSEVHRYSYRPVYEAAMSRGMPIPAYVKAGPAASAASSAAAGPRGRERGVKVARGQETKNSTKKN
jgi:ribonuclease HII